MIQNYLKEIKLLKPYIISIIAIIVLSYSIYACCSDDTIGYLGNEDGFFEWMTAIFFLLSSVIFFLVFRRSKNIFLLCLAVMFFVATGEEISWGQRLFGFGTPDALNKVNVQHEFNIHNLAVFNSENLDGKKKVGFERIFEINMLFRLFSMAFLICSPLFFYHINRPRILAAKRFQVPVAPFTIGIFFLLSWATFYSLKYFILPRGKEWGYYLSTGEVFEFTAACVYFAVALYFYNNKNDGFLGKDIKQALR
jgi:hypothetical protein